MLGANVELPTLTGPVRLKIPSGSHAHQKLKLKGKGLPKREGGYGDQFAILEIIIPSTCSPEERHYYEQLSKMSHSDPRQHLMEEAKNA